MRSRDWLIRRVEDSRRSPAWLGLGVALAWLAVVGIAHLVASATVGPIALPFGPGRFALTVVVNGALIGLILASHVYLHRGAIGDLRALEPVLPGRGADVARLVREVPEPSSAVRIGATLVGVCGGLAIATLDPTLRGLYEHVSVGDPRYLVYVLQNLIFGGLGGRLFAAELHTTRAYARLGDDVEVDLLDLSRLRVFARKGLRSVVVWALLSTMLSLFWVLDSAGQSNVLFPFAVLALVLAALVAPTLGVHRSIAAAKAAELTRVAEAIRRERERTLGPRPSDGSPEDARLGNLIAYQGFVQSVREWPFDLSTVWRSLLLIVLGVGSWLGGALVERLLDAVLG